MIIYLAGDMQSGWQDNITNLLPQHEFIDPRTHGLTDPAEYTKWDLDGVSRADVVVVYMHSGNPSGFGLSIEAGYANGLGKKIVFIDQISEDWRSKYFNMLRQIAIVVPTFVEAASLLR